MTKDEFTYYESNWHSHRPLLWEALESTKHFKLPVLELGCGDGSTPFLQSYCKENHLELLSYDFNQEWAQKFGAIHVTNWDNIPWRKEYSVALIDEAPGEHRKISIRSLQNTKILVCHDTEPAANHGYKMRAEFARFKYMIDFTTEGAWASAVSNFVDVTKWEL